MSKGSAASVVFMYPGQGCQHYHMGRDLYETNPCFRAAMDECEEVFRAVTTSSLLQAVYDPRRSATDAFDDVVLTHPAIVAVEVSLTRVMQSQGVTPRYLLGYSLGEVSAAIVGGVLSLREGLELAIRQGMLLQAKSQAGGMLAILERADVVARHGGLFARCAVAAYNFDRHFVVSGPREDLLQIKEALIEREIACSLLPVAVAFHSRLMDEVEAELRALSSGLRPRAAAIEIVSSTRGGSITSWDADFAWDLARRPVRFQQTVAYLERQGPHHYLDLGPTPILSNFLKHALAPESRSSRDYALRRKTDG